MANPLFTLASQAVRRRAQSAFSRSPVGAAVRSIQRFGMHPVKSGLQKAKRAISNAERELMLRQFQLEFQREINRYSLSGAAMQAVSQLLGALGPLGNVLNAAIRRRQATSDQLKLAADLLRAYGHEVLVKPGQSGYERGLEAARQLVEESKAKPQPKPAPSKPQPQEEEPPRVSRIYRTPQSSNVYSFQYDFEKSTLFVMFQGSNINTAAVKFTKGSGRLPGMKGTLGKTVGGKTGGPGPLYAYYDVPVRVFNRLVGSSSAGGAVWDNLRIRGTVYGHQYRYGLVEGQQIESETGQKHFYVPRRATSEGFKSRSLAQMGTGRRSYVGSTLPEENRPFRGAPDRGRSWQARSFRGR